MAIYMWREGLGPLGFTANTASSTIQLTKTGSPTAVTLETSTDGNTWTTYIFGNTITLSNIGDKVYWRNTSTTTTSFNTNAYNLYQFVMTGSIAASGDVTSLVNKNCTDTLVGDSTFSNLFKDCSSLTMPPSLPATTLVNSCYTNMFYGCTNLVGLPKLPALNATYYSYVQMFYLCSKIKISSTQTGEYQTPYRIPTEGTGTQYQSLSSMFALTGGTFTSDPSINTTYYTSNTLV